MKTRFILLLTAVIACNPFVYEDEVFVPDGRDAAIVTRSVYVSHSAGELIYDVDIVLPAAYAYFGDNYIFSEDGFDFQSAGGTTTILEFDQDFVQAPAVRSSTIVLVDAGASYAETDPANTRSQVINKFMHDHRPPHDFLIGAFSRNGMLTDEPVEYFDEFFGTAWSAPRMYIFDIARRTGGESALYDALYDAIDRFDAGDSRKLIVTLVNGPDGGSVAAVPAIQQHAKDRGVEMHFVGMGSQPNDDLVALAAGSGGIYSLCPTAQEMITSFTHLERMLHGESYKHRFRLRFVPASGVVQSGFELRQQVQVTDTYFDFDYNKAFIYIRVP